MVVFSYLFALSLIHISFVRKHRDHLWETLGALGAVAFGAGLLLYPAHVQESVAASSLYCLTALVPSLFPLSLIHIFPLSEGKKSPSLKRVFADLPGI